MKGKTSLKGFADILIGLQYGDEGKARVVDFLAKNYDIIARFNGGANAGHTIETKEGVKVALNQVPSAIFYKDKILYIGSGCVVNIEKLAKEIEKVEKLGVSLKNRLKISCQASVVQPHHILVDAEIGKTVGSTKNGIGPCYADKAFRMYGKRLLNIRLGDLMEDGKKYFENIKNNLDEATKFYNLKPGNSETQIKNLFSAFNLIKEYIEMDTLFLQKKVEKGAKVLFEGAQSVMLDVTKGSVPYVTSSSTIAPAAFVGGDLSTNYYRKTIGIAKAIMSRVGNGPFASEMGGKKSEEYCMADEGIKYNYEVEKKYNVSDFIKSTDNFKIGIALRILSGEYGTVTKRPRRVGMFDLVQLSYAIKLNGVNDLVINKCDLLNEYSRTKYKKIPLVVAYKIGGKKIDYVPGSSDTYYKVKPEVVLKEGFDSDISKIKKFSRLPASLKDLIKFIEKFCGCAVFGVGVGPKRDQFIKK